MKRNMSLKSDKKVQMEVCKTKEKEKAIPDGRGMLYQSTEDVDQQSAMLRALRLK